MIRRACAATAALLLAGCERSMSAMDPAGAQADRIAELTLLLVITGGIVYVLVIGFMLFAAWRGSRRTAEAVGRAVERRMTVGVVAAIAVTTVILVAVLVLNLRTGHALASHAEPDAIAIRVIGRQWWWEVEYLDPRPDRRLVTANEIHIPVGVRVRIETESRDVIHSFWAPNLHGKIDAIPGYAGSTYLEADEPGVYTGQCAEFCGHQHARMRLLVIAESPDGFARWYEHQLRPAPSPADSLAQVGEQVFLARQCVMCHTVRGTLAGSSFGPDLTHLASRRTIAAATLPNTRGNLAGWILDPQRIKPGVHMPANALPPDELHALLAYLESLR